VVVGHIKNRSEPSGFGLETRDSGVTLQPSGLWLEAEPFKRLKRRRKGNVKL